MARLGLGSEWECTFANGTKRRKIARWPANGVEDHGPELATNRSEREAHMHGCPKCYRRPSSNRDYWDAKVARNRARDAKTAAQLKREGWRVLRIWEHQLSGMEAVLGRIRAALEPHRTKTVGDSSTGPEGRTRPEAPAGVARQNSHVPQAALQFFLKGLRCFCFAISLFEEIRLHLPMVVLAFRRHLSATKPELERNSLVFLDGPTSKKHSLPPCVTGNRVCGMWRVSAERVNPLC
jgi:hypothetical protein